MAKKTLSFDESIRILAAGVSHVMIIAGRAGHKLSRRKQLEISHSLQELALEQVGMELHPNAERVLKYQFENHGCDLSPERILIILAQRAAREAAACRGWRSGQ